MKLTKYIINVLVALDRVVNSAIGGNPAETLSSVAYRKWRDREPWGFMMHVVNGLFWFTPEHCRLAYLHDRERKLAP